jgi:protein-S-isoprenylcysteine O-methyltransferase Ste14
MGGPSFPEGGAAKFGNPSMTTPRMTLFATLSSVVYLGLAIAGAGGFSAFFSHPPLIAVTLALFALTGSAQFSEASLSSGIREDRSNRWIIAALGVLGLIAGFLPAYTDRIDFWTIGGEGVRWLGFALFAIGGVLRMAPVFVLGRRFSGLVAIQPDHRLVTDGLYRVIRNPSYLGLIINALGWALAFRSLVGVGLAALMMIPLVARMNSEERLLADQFGAEYEAYRARTWRLVPFLY